MNWIEDSLGRSMNEELDIRNAEWQKEIEDLKTKLNIAHIHIHDLENRNAKLEIEAAANADFFEKQQHDNQHLYEETLLLSRQIANLSTLLENLVEDAKLAIETESLIAAQEYLDK